MKRSGFKDSLFLFLKKVGIKTAYSRLLETEKVLKAILSDMSCFKCRPLDRKHQHIQIIQVRDAADVIIYTGHYAETVPLYVPITKTEKPNTHLKA